VLIRWKQAVQQKSWPCGYQVYVCASAPLPARYLFERVMLNGLSNGLACARSGETRARASLARAIQAHIGWTAGEHQVTSRRSMPARAASCARKTANLATSHPAGAAERRRGPGWPRNINGPAPSCADTATLPGFHAYLNTRSGAAEPRIAHLRQAAGFGSGVDTRMTRNSEHFF